MIFHHACILMIFPSVSHFLSEKNMTNWAYRSDEWSIPPPISKPCSVGWSSKRMGKPGWTAKNWAYVTAQYFLGLISRWGFPKNWDTPSRRRFQSCFSTKMLIHDLDGWNENLNILSNTEEWIDITPEIWWFDPWNNPLPMASPRCFEYLRTWAPRGLSMMRYARHDHLGLTNDIINDFKEIQQVFMCWLYNVIYIYIYTANAWVLPGPAMTTGDASSSSSSSSPSSSSSELNPYWRSSMNVEMNVEV